MRPTIIRSGVLLLLLLLQTVASFAQSIPLTERWINPALGNPAASATGAINDPFKTAEQLRTWLGTLNNANCSQQISVVLDTRQAPLYLDTANFYAGANVGCLKVRNAVAGVYADVRGWKQIANANFARAEASNPARDKVYVTADSQKHVALWEWTGGAPHELYWYTHVFADSYNSSARAAAGQFDFGSPVYASAGEALQSLPGSFFVDPVDGKLYVHPFGDRNPATDGVRYVRSHLYNNDLGLAAFQVECKYDIQDVQVSGVALVSGIDFGSSNAFKLVPGSGTNTLVHCRADAWGKHALGIVEGAPQHIAITEDFESGQGAPWSVNGGQTALVSYAGTPYLRAHHIFRNIRSERNVGVVSSLDGAQNIAMSGYISHNNNVGFNNEQQYESVLFEGCRFPGQVIAEGVSIKRGGFVVRDTLLGAGTSLTGLFEHCEFDAGLASIFADNSTTETYLKGLSVTMLNCLIKRTSVAYGYSRAVGDTRIIGCEIDDRNWFYNAAIERHPNPNIRLKLTMTDTSIITRPGGGINGQNSMLLSGGSTLDDFSAMQRNRYHIPVGHWLLEYSPPGASNATRPNFAEWRATGADAGSFVAGTDLLPTTIRSTKLDEPTYDGTLRFVQGDERAIYRKIEGIPSGHTLRQASFVIDGTVEKTVTSTSPPASGYIVDDGAGDGVGVVLFQLNETDTIKLNQSVYDYEVEVQTNIGLTRTPEQGEMFIRSKVKGR